MFAQKLTRLLWSCLSLPKTIKTLKLLRKQHIKPSSNPYWSTHPQYGTLNLWLTSTSLRQSRDGLHASPSAVIITPPEVALSAQSKEGLKIDDDEESIRQWNSGEQRQHYYLSNPQPKRTLKTTPPDTMQERLLTTVICTQDHQRLEHPQKQLWQRIPWKPSRPGFIACFS